MQIASAMKTRLPHASRALFGPLGATATTGRTATGSRGGLLRERFSATCGAGDGYGDGSDTTFGTTARSADLLRDDAFEWLAAATEAASAASAAATFAAAGGAGDLTAGSFDFSDFSTFATDSGCGVAGDGAGASEAGAATPERAGAGAGVAGGAMTAAGAAEGWSAVACTHAAAALAAGSAATTALPFRPNCQTTAPAATTNTAIPAKTRPSFADEGCTTAARAAGIAARAACAGPARADCTGLLRAVAAGTSGAGDIDGADAGCTAERAPGGIDTGAGIADATEGPPLRSGAASSRAAGATWLAVGTYAVSARVGGIAIDSTRKVGS